MIRVRIIGGPDAGAVYPVVGVAPDGCLILDARDLNERAVGPSPEARDRLERVRVELEQLIEAG